MFALTCVLLPLSNKITGPIEGAGSESVNITGSRNGSVPDYSWSSSGLGSEMNETDYCGNGFEVTLVNDNSIRRIPWHVWIVLCLIIGVMVMSRYV